VEDSNREHPVNKKRVVTNSNSFFIIIDFQ
jgi:hypothetical protein